MCPRWDLVGILPIHILLIYDGCFFVYVGIFGSFFAYQFGCSASGQLLGRFAYPYQVSGREVVSSLAISGWGYRYTARFEISMYCFPHDATCSFSRRKF